ncbi:hypothetical protein SEA_UTZCHIPS_33 [Microbacterium phage UtzChips]|nr:hypothetical protein SEA_UTZCHIPS_33 [Microbacterium phage UtzChips]
MTATTESHDSQPDDLADGIYRDQDGDVWLVQSGTAFVLTDALAAEHGLGDITVDNIGEGIDADVAHLAYVLRMMRAL